MKLLAILLFLPLAVAQLPHPGDNVVHNPYTIEDELQRIQALNPDGVTYWSMGASTAGHDIWVMGFHTGNASADELALLADVPALYLDGNHHGNEHLGMEATLIFMEELAQWSTTAEGQARLQEIRVYAAPMINPDGTLLDRRINMNHVDLNRNYPYHWGLYGTSSSANPLGGTYRGPSEASEVETQANVQFMQDALPDVYLSMHTGSHDIVLPWRASEDGEIPDWNLYEAYLGEIKNVSGLDYRDPSGAGESISYAYGALGALSLIVEVDTTQNDVAFLNGITPMLQEEVEIFWWTVHNLHRLGGYMEMQNGTLTNTGLGAAYNVTYLNTAGKEVIEPVIAPGNSTSQLQAQYVSWERRIQGDDHRAVWTAEIGSFGTDSSNATPLPLIVLLAALAIAVVRRR